MGQDCQPASCEVSDCQACNNWEKYPEVDGQMVRIDGGWTSVHETAADEYHKHESPEITEMKIALQDRVLQFVQNASIGVPCTYLRERSQERIPAVYSLDNAATYLIVFCRDALEQQLTKGTQPSDSSPAQLNNILQPDSYLDSFPPAVSLKEVATPIGNIIELEKFTEAGEKYFPKSVVEMLDPDEMERLLMVVFVPNVMVSRKQVRFCLLMESEYAVADFIESMNVLAVYSRTDNNVASIRHLET